MRSLIILIVLLAPGFAIAQSCAPGTYFCNPAPDSLTGNEQVLLRQGAKDKTDTARHFIGTTPIVSGQFQTTIGSAISGTLNINSFAQTGLFVGDGSNDDALSLRNAISVAAATGVNRIFIPPGDYYCKSTVVPAAPVVYQPVACALFNGSHDLVIDERGARWHQDNSVVGPHAEHLNSGASFFGFQGDFKRVWLLGGEFISNRSGLSDSVANAGIWFESGTDFHVSDVDFQGSIYNGDAISGVYCFECTFERVRSNNAAIVLDLAWVEDLSIRDVTATSGSSVASAVVDLFGDPATVSDNVVTDDNGNHRSLSRSCSYNVDIDGVRGDGYSTSVAAFDTDTARLRHITVNGGKLASGSSNAGVTLGTTGPGGAGITDSSGVNHVCRGENLSLTDSDITGAGDAPGSTVAGGVVLSSGGYGVDYVDIKHNRIYDNFGQGVALANFSGSMGHIHIDDNDFVSRMAKSTPQTVNVNQQLQSAIAITGSVCNNYGVNPTDVASNLDFPTLSGPAHITVNNNPFTVMVNMWNRSDTVIYPRFLRGGQTEPDNIDPEGIVAGRGILWTLLPGQGIYFDLDAGVEQPIPTDNGGGGWLWRGMKC